MKKAILTFCAVLSLLALPAKVLAEVSIGITLAAADVDTKVTDDIDSNGTVNTTKEITNANLNATPKHMHVPIISFLFFILLENELLNIKPNFNYFMRAYNIVFIHHFCYSFGFTFIKIMMFKIILIFYYIPFYKTTS